MTDEPLSGPTYGVWQAHKRLEELQAEFVRFIASGAYDVDIKVESDGWRRLCVVLKRPIPAKWGLLAREAGDHLRSALNEIVTDLSILDTGRTDSRGSYPLYSSETEYRTARRDQQGRARPSPRDQYLKGLTEAHRAIVDRHQPYNDPLLVDLQSISNLNKHHRLQAGLLVPTTVRNHVQPHIPGTIQRFEFDGGDPETWIQDGAVILSVRPWPDNAAKMDVEGQITLEPAFGERRVPFNRLGQIPDHIFKMIEVVKREFPRNPANLIGMRPNK